MWLKLQIHVCPRCTQPCQSFTFLPACKHSFLDHLNDRQTILKTVNFFFCYHHCPCPRRYCSHIITTVIVNTIDNIP